MKATLPRGVFDIFPYIADTNQIWRRTSLWQHVERVIHQVCTLYGFSEIRTPVFEKTEVFIHAGESSDIVQKEMYTFLDKRGRSLTLRPEGTAAVVRSLLEHSKDLREDNKFYYVLPMFRYERQQAGRYRQHHQFGLEALGVRHPLRDVEILALLWQFYSMVGLQDMHLHLNFLGGASTRKRYNAVLRDYFGRHVTSLSQISQIRYTGNLLRILDSKEPEDQELIREAPSILDFVDSEDLPYFEEVLAGLGELGIPYIVNPRLVRGLDYYTDLVFEAVTSYDGCCYALGGGGRYDELVSASGGKELPACGFGVGIERVIQTLIAQKKMAVKETPRLRLIPMERAADNFCFSWAQRLRQLGAPTEVDWSHKRIKQALRTASAEQVTFVCPVGERELTSGCLTIKNMVLHQEFSGLQHDVEKRLLYEIQNSPL